MRVWTVSIRLLHWLLVTSVVASWWTRHGYGSIHEWLGYCALAVVALRVVMGLVGHGPGRFARFVRAPARVWRYARSVVRGDAPRYLGHNPLGGWMAVALLVMVAAVSGSGWLYTTDRFWGLEWVENLHDGLTWALIGLVALHVSGVIHASLRHRENLAAAMLHGRKRAPEPGDVVDD